MGQRGGVQLSGSQSTCSQTSGGRVMESPSEATEELAVELLLAECTLAKEVLADETFAEVTVIVEEFALAVV